MGKQKFSKEWEDFILSDLKRQKLMTYYHLVRLVSGIGGEGGGGISALVSETIRAEGWGFCRRMRVWCFVLPRGS